MLLATANSSRDANSRGLFPRLGQVNWSRGGSNNGARHCDGRTVVWAVITEGQISFPLIIKVIMITNDISASSKS